MDDAKYVFNQTSSERKRICRGSYAKKGGSKSRKCSLPSDRMTATEKNKMNGECKVYNISKPMTWKEFRSMPKDLQSEYIRKLVKMGATIRDMSEMMGTTPGAYSNYMYNKHNGEKFFDKKEKVDNSEFKKWLTSDKPEAVAESVETKQEAEAEPTTTLVDAAEITKVSVTRDDKGAEAMSGLANFTGRPEKIFAKMGLLFDEDCDYEITVKFRKKVA